MNMTDQIGYDLNEQDIDGVIRFLKVYDPENATPEVAIDFLTYMKLNLRKTIGENDPEKLTELYEQFKNNRPDENR